jgi:hypothetical protein
MMRDEQDPFPGQVILMVSVALDELRATEAECDLARVRMRIVSVEGTLKELLALANKRTQAPRLGL